MITQNVNKNWRLHTNLYKHLTPNKSLYTGTWFIYYSVKGLKIQFTNNYKFLKGTKAEVA